VRGKCFLKSSHQKYHKVGIVANKSEIFFFKRENGVNNESPIASNSLNGVSIREDPSIEHPDKQGKKIYSFSMRFTAHLKRKLYFSDEQKMLKTMSKLMGLLGCRRTNIGQYYILGQVVGEGKFGCVRMATERLT